MAQNISKLDIYDNEKVRAYIYGYCSKEMITFQLSKSLRIPKKNVPYELIITVEILYRLKRLIRLKKYLNELEKQVNKMID